MSKNDTPKLEHRWYKMGSNVVWIYLIIYVLLAIYLLQFYVYDPISRDLLSFISISQIYQTGDFSNAINGYWGPLFSWILTPLLFLDSEPLSALYYTKILSLIIGFFTFLGIRLLSYRLKMDNKTRLTVLFPVIFIILYFALRYNPVDLLLLCFLVYYLYFIFNPQYHSHIYNGLCCGLMGGLAFLTKSYALPFFLVHFSLFNWFHYSYENKKKVLKNFILGLFLFFIISGSWAVIISEKYGYPTFGTSGQYNYAEVGPVQINQGSPIWHGFLEPSNERAISAWVDPSYMKMASWSPLGSWSSLKHQIVLVYYNMVKIYGFFTKFSYFSILIILAYILILIRPWKENLENKEIFYPLITLLIYSAGYVIVFVEFRYLYLDYMLLLLMGVSILYLFSKKKFFTPPRLYFLTIILILSFIITPITSLYADKGTGEDVYILGNTIAHEYDISGNIASNDNYMGSLYLSYILKSKYYGTSLKNWNAISDNELEKDLQTYNIDYYLVWGDSQVNIQLLSKYEEITEGKIKGLKIYAIKRKKFNIQS